MFHIIYQALGTWASRSNRDRGCRYLTLDLEDGLGKTANVVRGDTGDGDTAITSGVDGVLLCELVHLLGSQASVGEHADLVGDVVPVVLGAELLKVGLEEGAHLDDAVGHILDLAEPLLVELGVAEDGAGDAGTVDGRVGVHGADENLELGVDALALILVGADKREGTNTLTVETHVLGERLAESNLLALLNKVADGKGILVSAATGEALVGHVEEGEVALGLDELGNLAPLSLGRIDTSGVVSTGVEEEDAALGSGLDIGNHALKVEANGVLVVVAVLLNLETSLGEDGLVVGPRGSGDVDLLLAVVELLEEGGADAESTSTGEGLGDDETVKSRRVGAVSELGGEGRELRNTGNSSVLLVHLAINNLLLGSADRGEDKGLAPVITVSTNT